MIYLLRFLQIGCALATLAIVAAMFFAPYYSILLMVLHALTFGFSTIAFHYLIQAKKSLDETDKIIKYMERRDG